MFYRPRCTSAVLLLCLADIFSRVRYPLPALSSSGVCDVSISHPAFVFGCAVVFVVGSYRVVALFARALLAVCDWWCPDDVRAPRWSGNTIRGRTAPLPSRTLSTRCESRLSMGLCTRCPSIEDGREKRRFRSEKWQLCGRACHLSTSLSGVIVAGIAFFNFFYFWLKH